MKNDLQTLLIGSLAVIALGAGLAFIGPVGLIVGLAAVIVWQMAKRNEGK